MEKETIITLKVEASKANQEVKGVKNNLDKAKDSTDKLNKSSSKTPRLLKGVGNGFKFIGSAMKAAGIGLIIGLLAKLTEVLSKNQKVIDIVNTSMEFLSRVFNDLFTFISDSIDPVKEFFTDIFENPVENIEALGTAIKENIIERFESAIEVFGFAGTAIKKFLEGDFEGAANAAKEASNELVDVFTGVDDSATKIASAAGKAAGAMSRYTTETYNSADSQVELQKQAKLAEAQIRQSILAYQSEIEVQRQIRDNVSNTIEERIAANEKAGELLLKQGKEEKALAQIQVNAAQAALDANKGNVDLQIALKNAKTELIDVEERILGFQSEQQLNEQALIQERKENLKQIELIGKTEREQSILTAKQKRDDQRELIERTISDDAELKKALMANEAEYAKSLEAIEEEKINKINEIKNKFIPEDDRGLNEEEKFQKEIDRQRQQLEEELTLIEESEEEKAKIREEFERSVDDKKEEFNKNQIANRKATTEQEIALVAGGISAITDALAEGSNLAKGFALAEALYNTYIGITTALKSETLPQRIAGVAFATATGFGAVDNILSTNEDGSNVSGGGRGTPTRVPSAGPRFDVVGDSDRLRNLEDETTDSPQEVFVVSKKVTSQQELDRNKQNNSRFI